MKVTMTQTKMPVMDMNEITTEFTLTQDGRPVGYFTIKGIRILCRVYVGINLAGRVRTHGTPQLHNCLLEAPTQ